MIQLTNEHRNPPGEVVAFEFKTKMVKNLV